MLLRIFARLHGGVRIRVGWVERSETHHAARRTIDGFRKGSTHPARYGHATFRGGPTNAIPNGSQNAGSVGAIAFVLVISKKNASA